MSGYFPVLTAAVFGSFFRVIINWFDTMIQKSSTFTRNKPQVRKRYHNLYDFKFL